MPENICMTCRRPKASLSCELCSELTCKDCAHFLEESSFSFFKEVTENLTHTHYCSSCFGTVIEPARETYNEIMERAKGLYFFFTTQRRQIPVLKRAKESIEVKGCPDRDETILRLAFLAAEQGFNAVMEAEISAKKVRNEGYQKAVWKGVGVPAFVDAPKLERAAGRE